jgi:hypothetical protein
MTTHEVELRVKLTLEDMDGTAEESAGVAFELVHDALFDFFPPGEITEVEVTDYGETQ